MKCIKFNRKLTLLLIVTISLITLTSVAATDNTHINNLTIENKDDSLDNYLDEETITKLKEFGETYTNYNYEKFK